MGSTAKVANVIFRFFALCSAAIVAGIIGHGIYLIGKGGGNIDSRIIYTEALAGISIFFALIFLPPFIHAFWAAPLDLAIFIMWMVSFGLLENASDRNACSAYWQYNYWGYYWGYYWRDYPVTYGTTAIANSAGCIEWRTALAFIFLGGMCWFVNACIGAIHLASRHDEAKEVKERKKSTSSVPPQTPHTAHTEADPAGAAPVRVQETV